MKELINNIVDLPKLIFRIWICLWLILFMLLIGKYCFGQWYPIVCDNENFINICNFIDNNKVLQIILGNILYVINLSIGFLIFTKSKVYKLKFFIASIIVYSIIFYVKYNNNIIGFIFEAIYLMTISISYNTKFNKFKYNIFNIIFPIIMYIIVNLWQFNILLVRDLPIILSNCPTLVQYLMQIDYYVFLIITWIGVNCIMGWLGMGWFWGKDITTLKAEKEKELAKENPNMDKIAEIDAKIAELEKEDK